MVKLSSPQSYRVVNYLLAHPFTTQLKISADTRVSLGLVNHVVRPLFERGVCRRGKWKSVELVDPLRLLEILAWERTLQRLVKSTVRLQMSEVSKAKKMIDKVCNAHKIDYALTTFAALSHYQPYYITYPTIHMYTLDVNRLESLLPVGRGAVAVEILKPDHDMIMEDVREAEGLRLVSPIQTVIDLFCFGEGGRDGAMKLLNRITAQGKGIEGIGVSPASHR